MAETDRTMQSRHFFNIRSIEPQYHEYITAAGSNITGETHHPSSPIFPQTFGEKTCHPERSEGPNCSLLRKNSGCLMRGAD
jgi:hypothetical protein